MRLTEARIRQIVRGILSEALRVTNAPRQPLGRGEPGSLDRGEDPFYLLDKDSKKIAQQVKKNFVLHPGFNSWIRVHREKQDDIVGELTRWNPRLEKSVYLYKTMEALARNPPPELEVPTQAAIYILLRGGRITAMYEEDPMTEYIETPSGWRYYAGSAASEPVEDMWFSRGTSGEKWTIEPEETPASWPGQPTGEQIYEATLVGGVPEALVIKNPELLANRYDPTQPGYGPPPRHSAQDVEDLVRILFSLDIPILDAQGLPLTEGALLSLVRV